jgi:exodeoxyribonuclease X
MIAHRVTHHDQHHGATPNHRRKAHIRVMIKLGYVALGLETESRATTCNTRSAFRCTTYGTRTMSGGTDAPTSDGRASKRMTDWTDLTYAVVDVEGNGQQPPDLVELATVPIVGGTIGESASWLVRPAEPIKYFATRIHGLTNKDVADAPEFAAISDEVLRALNGAVLVAHNAHVDLDVLGRKLGGNWQRPEVFDTLKLARRLVPGQASYRLGSLVEYFKLTAELPEGLTPHRATYDALVTARLFAQLATRARSLEELRGDPLGGGEDEAPPLF